MRVLLLLALLAGALASTPAVSADLVAGPMPGYATHREVALWAQTDGPTKARLTWWPADDPDARTTLDANAGDFHVLRFIISGLQPSTRYAYRLSLDRRLRHGAEGQFHTQPLRHSGEDPVDFTMAIGSCASVPDPLDAPDATYGSDPEIFQSMADLQPDLMLWLGDNHYYRAWDWTSRNQMAARWSHVRMQPALQPLLRATHHYAIWDDHDYGPNDSDRSFAGLRDSTDLFRQFWMNPNTGVGDPLGRGIQGMFSWGDADVFLLDNRSFRAPNDAPEGPGKVMWGEAQLQWLLDALTASDATFKIIANGGQVLNRLAIWENVATYPAARQRLLDGIAARGITGVVLVSGDRHHTELLRLERPETYTLLEYTSSPLTSRAYRTASEADNPQRVPGTWVTQRNFGTLTFSGPKGQRVLTMRAYDSLGALLWEERVGEAALR